MQTSYQMSGLDMILHSSSGYVGNGSWVHRSAWVHRFAFVQQSHCAERSHSSVNQGGIPPHVLSHSRMIPLLSPGESRSLVCHSYTQALSGDSHCPRRVFILQHRPLTTALQPLQYFHLYGFNCSSRSNQLPGQYLLTAQGSAGPSPCEACGECSLWRYPDQTRRSP